MLIAAGGLPAQAQLPTTPALSVDRQLVYGAAVDALASAPNSIVDGSQRQQLISDLATNYAADSEGGRQLIDRMLDAFDYGQLPGSFVASSNEQRIERIRAQRALAVPFPGPHTTVGFLVGQTVAGISARFFEEWDRWRPEDIFV